MRNSAYFKTFIAMSLIVFISFFLLGGLSTVFSYRRALTERRETMTSTLQETARYIATWHLGYGVEFDDLDVSMLLTMNSRITGFDILLANADGVVGACSESAFEHLEASIPDDILSTAASDGNYAAMSTLGQVYAEQRVVMGIPLAMSISGEVRPYGYLFVTSDRAMPYNQWRNFTTVFIMLALSVMSLAFVISFFASKKQAEPLIEIATAARRFARGDFDVRVEEIPDRRDEIAQLAEAFNYMADAMQSNEELRRDFITNLSHELKTPMTVIAGFAEGLLDGTIARKDEVRYLGIISSETKRLSRLVKSMLDISVLGETSSKTVQESSFDITEVAALALLSLEGKIEEKRLSVEAEIPEDPVDVRGSRDSIYQVVYNLIDNAIKYSHPGGTIKLELWQQAQRAFVSITNNGNTIPEDELPNIFRRFHKIDKSRSVDREGVGLGLYIVKTILDRHNEDIFVTSADGETKFMFSLTVV